MSYQLRMADEVRLWLHNLRISAPRQARLVGEAVTALIDEGPGIGPPLVAAVDEASLASGPGAELDRSYQRQLELWQIVRRGVADVETSAKRVELQISQLETTAAKLEQQRADSLNAGHDDEAGEAQARRSAVRNQLAVLRDKHMRLAAAEQELTAASQSLNAKVDAFPAHKETLKARFAAPDAQRLTAEAGHEHTEFAEPGAPAEHVPEAVARLTTALAAFGPGLDSAGDLKELLEAASRLASREPAARAGDARQAELLELRPGAPGRSELRLLVAIDPPGTAVLLATGSGKEAVDKRYGKSFQQIRKRLPEGSLTSYADGVFLREFFPGEGPEVEAGAVALARRARRHNLAEVRASVGLTQAQLAAAMNVQRERISEIEQAEPGANEVRELAAYVEALGGRLEIIADLGAERIVLH